VNPNPALAPILASLARRHSAGQLSDPAYAAGYFMAWQAGCHGRRYASRKSKADPRPDPASWFPRLLAADESALRENLLRDFERLHFLEVIPNVPLALAAWLRGEWPLTLMKSIPAPEAVLRMQVAGTRPVTVIADYARALRPVLTQANGFAFLIHDLEHAYQFFHDPGSHRAQRCLFRLLLQAVREGRFDGYRLDPVFAGRLDYVMSDMNTHVLHSLRFLSAALVGCLLSREGKGEREMLSEAAEAELAAWWRGLGEAWRFPADPVAALGKLAAREFGEKEAALLEAAVLAAGDEET